MPVQRPIPVWFGGGADAVLRRMARLGDGWMPNTMPLDQGRVMIEKLHGYLREEGRDPAAFGIDVRISARLTPADQWAAEIAAWRDLGATHVCINTMSMGFTTLDQHLDVIAQFKPVADAVVG
jgi:alkanesulfonate monooxygenase SsuD/methylene tetrahydromethanopterin reductase-like flavin-dependent oxidoreductase (luciferase family)